MSGFGLPQCGATRRESRSRRGCDVIAAQVATQSFDLTAFSPEPQRRCVPELAEPTTTIGTSCASTGTHRARRRLRVKRRQWRVVESAMNHSHQTANAAQWEPRHPDPQRWENAAQRCPWGPKRDRLFLSFSGGSTFDQLLELDPGGSPPEPELEPDEELPPQGSAKLDPTHEKQASFVARLHVKTLIPMFGEGA